MTICLYVAVSHPLGHSENTTPMRSKSRDARLFLKNSCGIITYMSHNYFRYRHGTASSVARDASSYDKQSSSLGLTFGISTPHWVQDCETHISAGGMAPPIEVCHSSHTLSGYHRSANVISNGQSILPYLKRPALKAAKMFSSG